MDEWQIESASICYSLAGQDTRPSPERPGLESRWRKMHKGTEAAQKPHREHPTNMTDGKRRSSLCAQQHRTRGGQLNTDKCTCSARCCGVFVVCFVFLRAPGLQRHKCADRRPRPWHTPHTQNDTRHKDMANMATDIERCTWMERAIQSCRKDDEAAGRNE